jgi:hypothetical protein
MKRILVFLIAVQSLYAQTPFSQDSALSYLKTISVTIGARPMGSPNERQAMEFAIAKFREFGLSEVYLMEMNTMQSELTRTSANTNSGVVVGIHKGKSNRVIVIGGHIDSASPFIPGANDDGSGAASVIELARVLSKEQLESTIVFCLFGGEEAGLCGSEYFVKHFSQIDSVALMMEIDMANGSEVLIPTIDSPKGNTPVWLVEATYEEFAKLKHSGLAYTTHFFTSMSIMPGGGVGSDHEPFLNKQIPAIDFTTDVDDPIHTPQDDFEHFKPSGLKRSGDLVYSLLHRFDNGVPAEKTSEYFLLQIGKRALFIPLWFLLAFNVLSIVLAIVTIFIFYKRRIETEKGKKPKIPALKLFLPAMLISTFVWTSENLIGLIKGDRYPWVAYPDGYFILGFFAALVGIILSLKFTQRLNLSRDPYRWFLRAVVFLIIFIALLSLANVKIAFYPSIGLFLLTLAMVVRNPWLKFTFWILAPHFMFRLIFSEGFIFLGRMTALHSTQAFWMYVVQHLFFIIIFALWSFPFLLGFAALYFDSGVDLLKLNYWKKRIVFIATCTAFLLCSVTLLFYPSYSDEWRKNINIDQFVDLNNNKGKIVLKSSEYLKDLHVHLADKDTNISTWNRELLLKEFTFDRNPWIQIEHTKITTVDSNSTFDLLAKVHFKYRPRNFTLSYSSGKNTMDNISGPYISSSTAHSVSMRWESFPDTSLMIPIHFRVLKSDSVTETIEAKFVELVEPVRIESPLTNILNQTNMRRTEVIKP